MALMERVSTLIRANLNDLVDKAEDPEKMLKQVILDLENQMLQVKTQVAITIADEHLLAKKQKENAAKVAEWMRKAEMAVDKGKDDLARAALDRVETFRRMGEALEEQVADQRTHAEALKTALRRLDAKLAETRQRCDLLIAQHRRSRAASKAAQAHLAIASDGDASADDRFEALERDDRIDQLLAELKSRRALTA